MAVVNPEISINMPTEIVEVLSETAKHNNQTISKVALDLIQWAIEEREDKYFSRTADEVVRSNSALIPNSDAVWE